MATKQALKPVKILKLVVGAGAAFTVGQFLWGSERFYGEVVSPSEVERPNYHPPRL